MQRSILRRVGACLAAASCLVLVAATPAWGHELPPTGFSQIRSEGDVVRYDLSLRYADVAAALGLVDPPGPQAPDPAGPQARDSARAAALESRRGDLAALVGEQVRLLLDGVECQPRLGALGAETFQQVPYATLSVHFACEGNPSGAYEVRFDLFLDGGGEQRANLVDYVLGDEQGRFVFHGDQRRLRAGDAGLAAAAGRFVGLGIRHILGGLDHVLFVLALLLGARSVRTVLEVATTFTVAHSVTLALAALGWVSLPSGVVEPLIALSIAYVAVENVVGRAPRHRLLVVFGFGLVHGLGFAGTLRFTDEASWRLLWSLLTFNVGIEVGQAMILLAAAPLVVLGRRLTWSRVVHVAATGLIGAVGVVWFVERLAGA